MYLLTVINSHKKVLRYMYETSLNANYPNYFQYN